MRIAQLTRFHENKDGVFGDLVTPDGEHYATVERPWLGNKPFVSCIPQGRYICEPRRYHGGGYDAIGITSVENRTHILMHIANFPSDVQGCIGINQYHKVSAGVWVGCNSRIAFNELMKELGNETFTLVIINAFD